jgi:hypothetical protein
MIFLGHQLKQNISTRGRPGTASQEITELTDFVEIAFETLKLDSFYSLVIEVNQSFVIRF